MQYLPECNAHGQPPGSRGRPGIVLRASTRGNGTAQSLFFREVTGRTVLLEQRFESFERRSRKRASMTQGVVQRMLGMQREYRHDAAGKGDGSCMRSSACQQIRQQMRMRTARRLVAVNALIDFDTARRRQDHALRTVVDHPFQDRMTADCHWLAAMGAKIVDQRAVGGSHTVIDVRQPNAEIEQQRIGILVAQRLAVCTELGQCGARGAAPCCLLYCECKTALPVVESGRERFISEYRELRAGGDIECAACADGAQRPVVLPLNGGRILIFGERAEATDADAGRRTAQVFVKQSAELLIHVVGILGIYGRCRQIVLQSLPRHHRDTPPTSLLRGTPMQFGYSDKVLALKARLERFMREHIYPSEERYFQQIASGVRFAPVPIMEELKAIARQTEFWNIWLPGSEHGQGLTNLEYAPLCEIMGRSPMAPEVFNCSAPDTGNMEVLVRYGTPEQKARFLNPLLAGETRSAFGMTEIEVASSDATNIETDIARDGDEYVINGRKWFTHNVPDPRCDLIILMGKTDPHNPDRHRQQSMVIVPYPHPGVIFKRLLPIMGFDDAPHGYPEVIFDNVRVPVSNILLGEGRGFEIAQGRLGPGRIHHCMRLIGLAERALERMCRRLATREAFGSAISTQSVWKERIAESRILIEQSRLLTLKAAWMMDTVGNKAAQQEIAMIKVAAPNMACRVIDWAMQAFGGAGMTDDYGLPLAYTWARLLRIADGPDEVHRNHIARIEFKKYDGPYSPDGASAQVRAADKTPEFDAAPRWIS